MENRLYQPKTYEPSLVLRGLRKGAVPLTKADVLDLYDMYLQGCRDSDVFPALVDFGQWMSATGDYEGQEPAEVVW